MNIRQKDIEPLLEAGPKYDGLGEKDLKEFLANFPDNAKTWSDATGELTELHRYLAEECGEQFKAAPNPRQDPAVNNKFHKPLILKYFKRLDSVKRKMFFEKYGQWFTSPLFESDTSMDNKQEKAVEKVLDIKSKQFQFDDGAVMGNMLSDVDTQFGLLWHDAKTQNFNDFIASVTEFLSSAKQKPTAGDIGRLKAHYEKYNWRTKMSKN
jgi:hypothetical protein